MAGLEISLRQFHFDYPNLIFLKGKTKDVNTLTSNNISLILRFNHTNHYEEHQELSVRIRNLIWRAVELI